MRFPGAVEDLTASFCRVSAELLVASSAICLKGSKSTSFVSSGLVALGRPPDCGVEVRTSPGLTLAGGGCICCCEDAMTRRWWRSCDASNFLLKRGKTLPEFFNLPLKGPIFWGTSRVAFSRFALSHFAVILKVPFHLFSEHTHTHNAHTHTQRTHTHTHTHTHTDGRTHNVCSFMFLSKSKSQ